MKPVEDVRADESVNEAQYAAPDDAWQSKTRKAREQKFQRSEMERLDSRVRAPHLPN